MREWRCEAWRELCAVVFIFLFFFGGGGEYSPLAKQVQKMGLGEEKGLNIWGVEDIHLREIP